MNIDRIMHDARLKIEWANSHIQTLTSQSSPLSQDLYEVVWLTEGEIKTPGGDLKSSTLTYRPKKEIPQHFALILGDAVHSLRASLDHWASALISEVNGTPRDTRVYFPFYGKGKKLEDAQGYKSIKEAVPDAIDFIGKEIKPGYDGAIIRFGPLPSWTTSISTTSSCRPSQSFRFPASPPNLGRRSIRAWVLVEMLHAQQTLSTLSEGQSPYTTISKRPLT